LNNKGYDQDKRGPVNFTHKKHAEDYQVACAECHHEYENGKNVWKETDPVKKCVECHDPVEKKGDARQSCRPLFTTIARDATRN
jgi:hypothetical protein